MRSFQHYSAVVAFLEVSSLLQFAKMLVVYHILKYFSVFLFIFRSTTANEAIVFPTSFLQRSKSFELLSNNAISVESVVELSRSAEAFSIEYFHVCGTKLCKSEYIFLEKIVLFLIVVICFEQQVSRLEASKNSNLIISPFSIWSLLLLLAEGSSGRTYEQFAAVLRLPNDLTKIRRIYKYIQGAFRQKNAAIELITNQVLFSDINRPIDINFQDILEHTYEADHFPVDFTQTFQTVNKINAYVRDKVKGKIEKIIDPGDAYSANLLLISAIFFQGQWKVSHTFFWLKLVEIKNAKS